MNTDKTSDSADRTPLKGKDENINEGVYTNNTNLGINKVVFFTGIIFILIAVCLLVLLDQNKVSRISYALLAIGTALSLSQVPVLIELTLPNGITAGGAAGMATILYFFAPNINEIQSNYDYNDAGKFLPNCKNDRVSIAVFTGGNLDYTRAIKTHLINSLQPQMNFYHKKCLYYEDYYVTNQTNDSLLQAQLEQTNFIKKKYDYYVTIGTSASVGLSNYFKRNNINGKKMIFLGVTDPVRSGLVSSISNRKEKTNITGVAYAGNFESLPLKIQEYFPNDTFVYIYSSKYDQDVQIGKSLEGIPLHRSGKLIIRNLGNREPTIQDFLDQKKVYFSWLTLENFFSTENISIIKNIKKIVSTTQTHAELGLLPLAVSTSDEEIGRAGTTIILKSIQEPKRNLGSINVTIPEWKSYINEPLARKNQLDTDAIDSSDQKYE